MAFRGRNAGVGRFIPNAGRKKVPFVSLGDIPKTAKMPTIPVDDVGFIDGGNQCKTITDVCKVIFDRDATRKYIVLQNTSDIDIYYGIGTVMSTSAARSCGILLAANCGNHEIIRACKAQIWAVTGLDDEEIDLRCMVGR